MDKGAWTKGKQELYTHKESSSPTVAIESVFLSSMIDVEQQRDVATANILGAYLHADMEDYILVRFTGQMVDIFISVDESQYLPFVQYDYKGNKIMYARLTLALD